MMGALAMGSDGPRLPGRFRRSRDGPLFCAHRARLVLLLSRGIRIDRGRGTDKLAVAGSQQRAKESMGNEGRFAKFRDRHKRPKNGFVDPQANDDTCAPAGPIYASLRAALELGFPGDGEVHAWAVD